MLLELLRRRRSIRKYADRPIEQHKLDRLLEAMLLAPTSKNSQAWEFVVVDDRRLLQNLSQAKPGAQHVADAALAVVIAADTEKSDVWIEDTSIAATHLLLMAEDLGLGACWVQIRRRFHDDSTNANVFVKNLLCVPQNCEVDSIIAIGYPQETKPPNHESRLPSEKIHKNRFGSR